MCNYFAYGLKCLDPRNLKRETLYKPNSTSSYLEQYDESQSCSQDTPVLFGEGVGVRSPGGFPVVFIPGTELP